MASFQLGHVTDPDRAEPHANPQVESLPCARFVGTPAFITRVSLESRKCRSPGATRRGQESSCALLLRAAIAVAIAAAPCPLSRGTY